MFKHSPLFQFKQGDHICVFYRSEDALMEVLSPYIAQGILRHERCFCAQRPETLKRLIYDLRFLGIDVDREISRGTLELHTEDETYFPNRVFEPSTMMDMLLRAIEAAQNQGFTGLRTAGEMSWAVRGGNTCDQILDYENLVDKAFPGKPVIGMCQYAVDDFTPETLACVLENHKMHLADTTEGSLHSSVSIRQGRCNVEIVVDKFVVDPPHYYVVQPYRQRSEILGWGVAPTFDDAAMRAEQVVHSFSPRPSF